MHLQGKLRFELSICGGHSERGSYISSNIALLFCIELNMPLLLSPVYIGQMYFQEAAEYQPANSHLFVQH